MQTMCPNGSSLARYLDDRGWRLLGSSQMSRTYRMSQRVSYFMLGLGVVLAVVLFAATGLVEASLGALGPLIAGGVNLTIFKAAKRRADVEGTSPVALTPQATGLLHGLMPNAVAFMGPGYQRNLRMRVANPLLNNDLHDLLEAAAFQANRVAAVLGSMEVSTDSSVRRLGPSSRQACDETMGEIFHHGAILAQYPESPNAPRAEIESRTRDLAELATRLESLQGSLSMGLPATSGAMGALLEDLRLQDLAHRELASDTSSEIQERVRGSE